MTVSMKDCRSIHEQASSWHLNDARQTEDTIIMSVEEKLLNRRQI